LRVIA